MNLTKTHRKHIAQLVMQDTPRRHKLDIQDRLQAIVDKAISERGPEGIRHLWKDKKSGQYLRRTSTNAGYLRPNPNAHYENNAPYVSMLFNYEFPDDDPMRAEVAAVLADHLEEQAQRNQVRQQLEDTLAGIRTRKQFLERLPELAKYAPTEPGADRSVPAIANVMAALSTMDWPGDESSAA